MTFANQIQNNLFLLIHQINPPNLNGIYLSIEKIYENAKIINKENISTINSIVIYSYIIKNAYLFFRNHKRTIETSNEYELVKRNIKIISSHELQIFNLARSKSLPITIKRCHLKSSSFKTRMLMLGSLVFPETLQIKSLLILESLASSIELKMHVTTENQKFSRSNIKPIKDKMYRIYLIALTALFTLKSISDIMHAFNYIDNNNTHYQNLKTTYIACYVITLIDTTLQLGGYIAERE
jgi:hypothetical protein